MQSAFRGHNTNFDALLEELATTEKLQDRRFPARNFLLESQSPTHRIEEYLGRPNLPSVTGDTLSDYITFQGFHNLYQENELRSGVRTSKFDVSSRDCPDTFRTGRSLEEFDEFEASINEEDSFLVRIEDINFIAGQTFTPEDDLDTLLTEIAIENRLGHSNISRRTHCDQIFQLWQDTLDNRPLFSAFWKEAKSVVGDPEPTWATELRDKLGMTHYDPDRRGSGISVVLFRYPLTLIPRAIPHGPRFLVRPTVLDGNFSDAFYTAPPDTGAGQTVDLVVRDDDPWQEVLHPAVEFKAEHVWATGLINSGPPGNLVDARAHHCLKLCHRTSSKFVDLCQSVDGDIL